MDHPEEVDHHGDPALAMMVHNTHLLTWLVRTAGKTLVMLILIPAVGALLAAWSAEPAWIPISVIVTVFVVLVYLTNADAPLPREDVTDLL